MKQIQADIKWVSVLFCFFKSVASLLPDLYAEVVLQRVRKDGVTDWEKGKQDHHRQAAGVTCPAVKSYLLLRNTR